ncbi:ABC-2 type transport system ATP-binding protein [Breznakia sp. PF5-3]|uniref:ABC transporter ATP-binding protein n=1 Tax=unclassified Breznakia TaxID=2623764 RepID=UPI0024051DE0|nr:MULTISPECIES: ABC transporter ATP-binding protein [unclassified Breznakia]MDF9824504.1 ABC-2 type transport system ATP-binding protein [Breznakia sp. PM6-1]MDF9835290.1 ABC-2 type transport system ATP-binding protein [Breznakia sp. PF5-3]MDF9837006.1 ABC-2 type transport system ATP-binding protein [Breznakia sp. PFB2-8]MDF9858931.1 ABC-2 type transport system ATP-binding protein [Breznakia sp. PH5-24]
MIEVKNLTKDYGKVIGANDVSLVAKPGEITILLGSNGAGKSTTIKSIIGLLKFKGSIKICSFDNMSVEAKKRFGYIPETPVLYDLLTIQEHIDFIGNAYQIDNYQQIADKYLTLFKLMEKKKTIAKELSKGMRQKLSMILALMTNPQALLVDEPMMGLDPNSIQDTLQILKTLKDNGVSILMSTHIIDMVDDVWDHAIIMKQGHVLADIERNELKDKSLKELFFELNGEDKEHEELI